MQPLNNIFNTLNFFRIPIYQRGYSWEDSQLKDFWNDIDNLTNNEHNHYMGMIGVERLNDNKKEFEKWDNYDNAKYPSNNHNFYHIVDGQQRLLTIIILISVIKNFMDKDDEEWFRPTPENIEGQYIFKQISKNSKPFYYLGYEVDTLSNNCLVQNIFNEDIIGLDKNKYTANMLRAKKIFGEELDKLKSNGENQFQKKLKKIYDILTTRLQFDFNEFRAEEISMIFETMNDRGKPLSNLEKLKNRLIYLTTILKEKGLISQIDKTWADVYQYLGRFENYTSDKDDFFLRNHWIMYKNYDKKESEFYKKEIFDQEYTVKNALQKNIDKNKIQEYSVSIQRSIEYWFYIYNPQHTENKIKDIEILALLNKLNYIGFKSFPPIILAAFIKNEPNVKIIRLLEIIEKHIFLLFYISFRRADIGSYNFYSKASRYYTNDFKSIEDITYDIEFNWTYGLDREKDETAGYIDANGFYSYMRELFVREKRYGFYSWSSKIGIKYFLMEYELFLNKNLDPAQIDYSEYYLELVFPGAVEDISEEELNANKISFEEETLMEDIPDIDNEYLGYLNLKKNSITKEDANLRLKKLKYTLGNIVLVKKQYTKVERRMSFGDKRNSNFIDREMLANEKEVFLKNDEWKPIDVLKRGFKLLDFMELKWGFHFDSWKLDKRKVLFLDFIDPNQ